MAAGGGAAVNARIREAVQVTAGVWWLVAGGVLYTGGVPLFLLDAAYYQQGVGAVFHLVRRDRYGRRCSVIPGRASLSASRRLPPAAPRRGAVPCVVRRGARRRAGGSCRRGSRLGACRDSERAPSTACRGWQRAAGGGGGWWGT